VQHLVTSRLDSGKIRHAAMAEGMQSLRMSGAARVARGETTIEEVMRVAPAVER
jgi:general secretion pathway protein E